VVSGRKRILGVAKVADRITQMVAKICLDPMVEQHFHPNSYGYGPGKSAIDAVAVTRRKYWWYDRLLEVSFKGLFDNTDHELRKRAVRTHTNCNCLVLYIERWLKATFQREDGELIERKAGTCQGGVIRRDKPFQCPWANILGTWVLCKHSWP